MTMSYGADVRLFQTPDDGEINVVNGVVEMGGGLETAVYLSLFGGNEDDSGAQEDPNQWWGNRDETNGSAILRSETQYLLRSLPVTLPNIVRLRDAVNRDLQWLIDDGAANNITVVVSSPVVNKVHIDITITAEGVESNFKYVENWKMRS